MSWIKQCSVEGREQRSEMKGATFPKYFVCVLAAVGCKHRVSLTANTETKGHGPQNSLLILWFLISVTVCSVWGLWIRLPFYSFVHPFWTPPTRSLVRSGWSLFHCILSFGWFPGVWILCVDVSEHFHLHRFFLLGGSPASEFYVPTFLNALSHFHRSCVIPHDLWKCNCWPVDTA